MRCHRVYWSPLTINGTHLKRRLLNLPCTTLLNFSSMSKREPISIDSDTESDDEIAPSKPTPVTQARRVTRPPPQETVQGIDEEEEDQDLKRAIAESLRASGHASTSNPLSNDKNRNAPTVAIAGPDSDDDEDLRRALAASLQDAPKGKGRAPITTTPSTEPPAATPPTMFMSERAVMEKARLERQKRLLGEIFDHTSSTNLGTESRPTKRAYVIFQP